MSTTIRISLASSTVVIAKESWEQEERFARQVLREVEEEVEEVIERNGLEASYDVFDSRNDLLRVMVDDPDYTDDVGQIRVRVIPDMAGRVQAQAEWLDLAEIME